jgi:hypothetical protein
MSFLNQLKSQAAALQNQKAAVISHSEIDTRLTEEMSSIAWHYVTELAKHLNVIAPPGPALSLDGKTHWPVMKLVDFRVDARKKMLFDKEVYDHITLAWRIMPRDGMPVAASVSGNFPPDVQRIEARLAAGAVKNERTHVRHPEKHTLQAIRFDYSTQARGSVVITPNHAEAKFTFRILNAQGFESSTSMCSATHIQNGLLDDLAKLILGQPHRFG